MNPVQPLFPHLQERLAGLEELAENLWWSWNPGARMLFKTLDRQAWKESGIPHEWVRLMKESIKSNAARFSARRMVKQYIEKFYSKSIQKIPKD